MRAAFVLPLPTDAAPAWLRLALAVRAATIATICPACGEAYDRSEIRPGEIYTPALRHGADCPATDPRLGSAAVLAEWVELRMVEVDLPDEAAA